MQLAAYKRYMRLAELTDNFLMEIEQQYLYTYFFCSWTHDTYMVCVCVCVWEREMSIHTYISMCVIDTHTYIRVFRESTQVIMQTSVWAEVYAYILVVRWFLSLEMDSWTRVQILYEAAWISHGTNTFGKGINPPTLPPSLRKIVGQTVFLVGGWQPI